MKKDTNINNLFCVNCVHFGGTVGDSWCRRPLSETVSNVSGEKLITEVLAGCRNERAPLNFLERLFNSNRCGAQGRHFKQKEGI